MEDKTKVTDEQLHEIYNKLDTPEINPSGEKLKEAEAMTDTCENELELIGTTDEINTGILGGIVPDAGEPEDMFKSVETYKDDGTIYTESGLRESFKEYDITDDQAAGLIVLINKYKNNEDINYYDELPEHLKSMADGLRANSGSTNVSKNSAAKFVLSIFINDAKMSAAIDEYNKEMGELFNESNSEFSMLMKQSIDDIFDNIDEIRSEDPEKAAKIEGIKKSFEEASTFNLQLEYLSGLTAKKLNKFYSRYKSECAYFNSRFKNEIKVPNIERIYDVIKRAKPDFSKEQIEKFIVVICKSVYKLDPNNIVDISYVYRMISNILAYEYSDDFSDDDIIFNNIEKCINKISTI